MSVQTTVDTGDKSEYIFKVRQPGDHVEIWRNSRGGDDNYARHYADYRGAGTMAVKRLVESHAELRAFFNAMRYLAEFDVHGRLVGFTQPTDCDTDELEAAREKVAEIFEAIADFEGLEL
jgi:hypothetical protein